MNEDDRAQPEQPEAKPEPGKLTVAPPPNGNGQAPPTPPVNLEGAEQIFSYLTNQNEVMLTLAANLAWLLKHPGARFAHTEDQMKRRTDYLDTLDGDAHEQLAELAGQICVIVSQSLSRQMVAGTRPRGPKLWKPGD